MMLQPITIAGWLTAYKVLIAIKDFNRAIELNNHADAYNGRGIAYRQIGKLTRAIADFDRSIELNPNFAKVYNNRAAAQRELENLDKQ